MARFILPELLTEIPGPFATSGRRLDDFDISGQEAGLSWLVGDVAAESLPAEIARDLVDRAACMQSWAWGETWQRIVSCPALGLPDHVGGLRVSLQDLAGQGYTLPAPSVSGAPWMSTIADLAGQSGAAQAIRWQDGRIRFDAVPLVQGLGDLASQRVANICTAAVASVPFAGWAVALLFSVGRSIARGAIEAKRIQAQIDDRRTWARPSGLCGIAAGSQGQTTAAWHTTADRLVVDEVLQRCAPKSASQWFVGYGPDAGQPRPQTDQSMAEAAKSIDLTYALLPHQIPSGQIQATQTGAQPGTLLIGEEDRDCSDSGQGPHVPIFSLRLAGAQEGSGYCPGLGRMVGRPVYVGRPGVTKGADYSPGVVLDRQDLGDILSAATTLCRQLEGLTLKAPWCFQVRTSEIERAWDQAIQGWADVALQLARRPGGGIPNKTSRGHTIAGRQWMAPAPWLNVSKVLRRRSNGSTYEALIPGPVLTPYATGITPNEIQNMSQNVARSVAGHGPIAAWSPLEARIGQEIDEARYGLRSLFSVFDIWSDKPLGSSSFPGSIQALYDDPFLSDNVDLSRFPPGVFEGFGSSEDAILYREYAHPQQDWLTLTKNEHGRRTLRMYARSALADWEARARDAWPVIPGGVDPIRWRDPSGWYCADPDYLIETVDVMRGAIEPYLARVRSAQWKALDTLSCAYVSHGAPAFEDSPMLLQKLYFRRNQLKTDPARFAVNLADVVDDVGEGLLSNFRRVLVDFGVPDPLVSKPGALGGGGLSSGPEPDPIDDFATETPAPPADPIDDFATEIPTPPPPPPGESLSVYVPPPEPPAPPPPLAVPSPPQGGQENPASEPDPDVVETQPKGPGLGLGLALAGLAAVAITRER